MKLIFNEKQTLASVLERLDKTLDKSNFSKEERNIAKQSVCNFHSMLTKVERDSLNSRFEKKIDVYSGESLTIIAITSNQQSYFSRLFN